MSVMKERRKYFKKEAIFFLRYNYIKQIFMTGLVILLTFGLNAVKLNIIKLFGLEHSFYAVPLGMFFDILIFFITLPMYAGIIYVNVKLFEGENLPVSSMFYYFTSSQNLLDCYRFIIALFTRLAIFVIPFIVISAFFPHMDYFAADLLDIYINSVTLDIVMVSLAIAYIAAIIVCVIVYMRYFASLFVFVKTPWLSVGDIMRKSARMMSKRKIEGLMLLLSFTLWILISHYFAGFLYIFFTFPYMALCYASFMSYTLTQKGGDEFLSAASDYIDKAVKAKTVQTKRAKKAKRIKRLKLKKKAVCEAQTLQILKKV